MEVTPFASPRTVNNYQPHKNRKTVNQKQQQQKWSQNSPGPSSLGAQWFLKDVNIEFLRV